MLRRIAALAIVLTMLLVGAASALGLPTITFTFPSNDDARTDCSKPSIPVPAGAGPLRCIVAWAGTLAWVDTVYGVYGGPGSLPARVVGPGTYTGRFTVVDSVGNKSCPLWRVFTIKSSPAQPTVPPVGP